MVARTWHKLTTHETRAKFALVLCQQTLKQGQMSRLPFPTNIPWNYGFSCGKQKHKFYHESVNEEKFGSLVLLSKRVLGMLPAIGSKRYFFAGAFRIVPNGACHVSTNSLIFYF